MAPRPGTKQASFNQSRVSKRQCPASHKVSKITTTVASIKGFNNIIIVKIGPAKKEFAIHEDLLAHRSLAFRAMLKNPCKESETKCIELPDTGVGLFQIFFSWLYSSSLPDELAVEPSEDQNKRIKLAKLWVFGDKYAASDFQNAILDVLRTSLSMRPGMPSTDVVSYVYSNTMPGATIRKLLIDFAVEKKDLMAVFDPAKDKNRVVQWDGEFVQETFYHFLTLYHDKGHDLEKAKNVWIKRDECEYHVHDKVDSVASAAGVAVTQGRSADGTVTVV